MKIISVFGSSAPKPGTEAYENAREVGRLLAEAGFTVATGGYNGTMAGVSQGAAEAGGHVIGVTADKIESFRPIKHNQWVTEEIRFVTLHDRLMYLVEENDGIITLPGSVGTLAEMTMAWGLMQVEEMDKRPFSLLGSLWRDTIKTYADSPYMRPEDFGMLHFADTPAQAVAHMEQGSRGEGER